MLKAEYKNKLLSKDDRKRLRITTLNLQVMARQLPPGCAGLDYGSPPHVRDAIVILKEAWDKISSSVISACWVHSALSPGNPCFYTELGTDTLIQIQFRQCAIRFCPGGYAGNLGLNVIIDAVKKVNDKAAEMLMQWLHLEDESTCNRCELSDSPDVEDTPVDKAQVLNNALYQLERLHLVGVKLNNFYIKDAAQQLYAHMLLRIAL